MSREPLVDAIRVRLSRVLALRQDAAPKHCPACRGSGTVRNRSRVWTQGDAADAAGVSRTQIVNFLHGKTDLSMAAGLRLLAWMDEAEATR